MKTPRQYAQDYIAAAGLDRDRRKWIWDNIPEHLKPLTRKHIERYILQTQGALKPPTGRQK